MTRIADAIPYSQAVPRTTVRRGALVAAAALGLLLVSRLPEIALREGLGLSVDWMPPAVVGASAVLWLAATAVPGTRPLRGFFGVMTGIALINLAFPIIIETSAWRSIVPPSTGEIEAIFTERVLKTVIAIAFIGLVVVLGTRPTDAYIRPGEISAPTGFRIPGTRRALRWTVVGPAWMVVLAALTAVAMLGLLPPAFDIGRALPLLGLAVVAALMNSFFEEVVYRSAPLSQLAPAVGASWAVVLLAVYFGLGHFYGGMPSGAVGAVMSGSVALLFGRAMIATRGLAWPWALHFSIDLVIYAGIALAASSSAA